MSASIKQLHRIMDASLEMARQGTRLIELDRKDFARTVASERLGASACYVVPNTNLYFLDGADWLSPVFSGFTPLLEAGHLQWYALPPGYFAAQYELPARPQGPRDAEESHTRRVRTRRADRSS
jgi:hypothetical protein